MFPSGNPVHDGSFQRGSRKDEAAVGDSCYSRFPRPFVQEAETNLPKMNPLNMK